MDIVGADYPSPALESQQHRVASKELLVIDIFENLSFRFAPENFIISRTGSLFAAIFSVLPGTNPAQY